MKHQEPPIRGAWLHRNPFNQRLLTSTFQHGRAMSQTSIEPPSSSTTTTTPPNPSRSLGWSRVALAVFAVEVQEVQRRRLLIRSFARAPRLLALSLALLPGRARLLARLSR